MARCNDATCNCVVQGGPGVSVQGAGTPGVPYLISVDQAGQINVVDTPTIDMALTSASDPNSPSELSATLTAYLHDLLDVAQGQPANGNVLAWNGTSWAPVPPTTSAPGAIAVSTGLTGDGSAGAPLKPVVDPSGGLAINTLGLAMSAATLQRLTNLEAVPTPQYLRAERSDTLTLVDGTWTVPVSMNVGVTSHVGTRLTYAGGYITVLDAGVYAWETSCTWASLASQASPFNRSCQLQINDVGVRYGQNTEWLGNNVGSSAANSYHGTVTCKANDKLRAAYYQNNPANATSSVVPNAFAVYRVA
jgi:hypothetical protein